MPRKRALPPIVRNQIKRLEGLLSLAVQERDERAQAKLRKEDLAKINPIVLAGLASSLSKATPTENNSPTMLRVRQALNEIAPNTEYVKGLTSATSVEEHISRLTVVLEELRSGNLNSIHDMAHAEAFNDVLDEAQYLLDQGYLVASAVTAGSAGEAHLKRLATKHRVAILDENNRPIKATMINAALKAALVYGKTMHKQIDAWQGVRNDAAHGVDVANVTAPLVRGMIDGLRKFMASYPA